MPSHAVPPRRPPVPLPRPRGIRRPALFKVDGLWAKVRHLGFRRPFFLQRIVRTSFPGFPRSSHVRYSEFPLIGTTAYWLPALNTDDDIDHTLGNISQAGFNVVRTWAFNGASFAYCRLRFADWPKMSRQSPRTVPGSSSSTTV